MEMNGWLILYVLFTFAISCWNAFVVGAYWSEKDRLPTSMQVLLWCGAIMAWIGFFYAFLVPTTWIFAVTHMLEAAGAMLKLEMGPQDVAYVVNWVFNLALVFVWLPLLGTGYVITVNSWITAFARRHWTDYGVAAYNTYASIRNTVTVAQYLPKIMGELMGAIFKKDAAKKLLLLVALFPIAVSALLSTVATMTIMKVADNKFQLEAVAK